LLAVRALLTVVTGCAFVGEAEACSIPRYELFFEPGSAQISTQGMNTVKQHASGIRWRIENRPLPDSCERLTIFGQADGAEGATPEIRIDVARAEAVRSTLQREGVDIKSISIEGRMGESNILPTRPGFAEAQNRNAWALWRRGAGRWRCDPETKGSHDWPTCDSHDFRGSCYWELLDGTICNFDRVPDPNPAKYSVILER
jgi:hypothetical protein